MSSTPRPLDPSIVPGANDEGKAPAPFPVSLLRLNHGEGVDATFAIRQTARRELDNTMPIRTKDELYVTPFRMTTPMPLRVGILRSMHFSLDEIAAMLFVSHETARKYSTRFFSEMAMSPPMAMRTTLAWSDFLLTGWNDWFSLRPGPAGEAA